MDAEATLAGLLFFRFVFNVGNNKRTLRRNESQAGWPKISPLLHERPRGRRDASAGLRLGASGPRPTARWSLLQNRGSGARQFMRVPLNVVTYTGNMSQCPVARMQSQERDSEAQKEATLPQQTAGPPLWTDVRVWWHLSASPARPLGLKRASPPSGEAETWLPLA